MICSRSVLCRAAPIGWAAETGAYCARAENVSFCGILIWPNTPGVGVVRRRGGAGGAAEDRQLGWGGLVGQSLLSADRDGRELGGEDYR